MLSSHRYPLSLRRFAPAFLLGVNTAAAAAASASSLAAACFAPSVPNETAEAIKGLSPPEVWSHFAALSSIPRPSGKEEAVLTYVKGFAESKGLRWTQDARGNLCVFRPGSGGGEEAKPVIIQGHVDMVTEKNQNTEHNFDTDPIILQRLSEGDDDNKSWLGAKGTTLGADNGLGCAAALALLGADESKVLPPIEALFTVEEETGLYGAADLDVKILGLTGKSMLNLDMEEYGDIFIGCAGGGDSTITLPLSKEVISADLSEIVEIRVEGLLGGHSGLNIHEHRGNAVIICAAAVQSVLEAAGDGGASLLSICGGDKHNAIPREASATLAINPSSRDVVERSVSASAMAAKEEYGLLEKSFKIAMNTKELSGEYHEALTKSSAQTLLAVLLALPHGPIKFSHAIPSLVESSSNLASISTDRKSNVATILCSSRSSIGTALEATRDKIKAVAYLAGAAVKQSKAYPGWAPNPSSEILEVTKCMFSKKLGRAPGVNAVHAGLECGLLMAKLGKDLDVVSYGPTITGAHSPDEKVDVSTVEPFFEVTEDILKEYAKRR